MRKIIKVTEDDTPWKILSILSVRLSEYYLKPHEKCLAFFFKVLSAVLLMHWFSANFYRICTNTNFDIGMFVYFLMSVQLALIWYFLKAQIKNICTNVEHLERYRTLFNVGNKKQCLVKAVAIAFIVLPILISTIIATFGKRESHTHYSYGYKIYDQIIVRVMTFYLNFVYFYSCTTFALITLLLSILIFQWGKVLREYNALLNIFIKKRNINTGVPFLKEFFNLTKIIQDLEKALQYPSLIIILYSLEMLFLIFWYVLENKKALFQAGNIVEVVFDGMYGFFMISVYCLNSSKIPENLIEIRRTAKYIINRYGNSSFLSRNVIFYLKRIEKEDIIYITACGLFEFTRKYLLSAIGAALTYNLLIINLK